MRHCKSRDKGKVHSITGLPQETRKKSIKKPNSTPKATREGRNEELQGQQKEINLNNQAEINAKETKETIAKINKATSWFFEKIKLTNHQQVSLRNKGRRTKLTKLETKTLKYKGS